MPSTANLGNRSRRKVIARAVVLLLALSVLIVLAWPHAMAWVNLERGKSRLEHDPVAARDLLGKCLGTWPDSAEAHFFAARAARLCGELGEADYQLDEAVRHGWSPALVDAERREVRAELQQLTEYARTLMSEFRWPEASVVVRRWVEIQPDSAAAWAAHGHVRERLREVSLAVESYRVAVRLAPNDLRITFELARLLLESRQPTEEAAGHLERLIRLDPNNPSVPVQLAVCREMQGRAAEAAAILDDVLARNPADAKALYFRGRLELNRGDPKSAVGYLRRSADRDPSDREALYSLVVALSTEGTPEEIRAAEERWKRCDADLKRVAELAKLVAASPENSDLRHEMGVLFLRNAREEDALRWFQSALQKKPDHLPTHRSLAEHYQRTGRPDLALKHTAFLKPGEAP